MSTKSGAILLDTIAMCICIKSLFSNSLLSVNYTDLLATKEHAERLQHKLEEQVDKCKPSMLKSKLDS